MPSQEFTDAVAALDKSPDNQSNDTKLALYGLYKQATKGDASGKRPGMFDLVGRAKYDAWAKLKGMSRQDAEAAYIKKADSILG
ncbi:MAG: acyl-CoA-binding protein [Tetrasphaera sp.]